MTLKKITTIAMVTLFGILLCTVNKANAQEDSDYGVIRISDDVKQTTTTPSATEGEVVTTGNTTTGNVVYEGRARRHPSPFKAWKEPTTNRVYPGFFYYKRAYPDYWVGQPQPAIRRTAPVIFTPTDTTQMGYYYQHVPQWQPNPNMIPPEPHPATWHNWKKLPNNVVWHRRGAGEPRGIVPPPGYFAQGTVVETKDVKKVKETKDKKPVKKTYGLPPVPEAK